MKSIIKSMEAIEYKENSVIYASAFNVNEYVIVYILKVVIYTPEKLLDMKNDEYKKSKDE